MVWLERMLLAVVFVISLIYPGLGAAIAGASICLAIIYLAILWLSAHHR